MPHPIINIADVEPQPLPPSYSATGAAAERYAPRIAWLSPQLGAQKLGYNITALAPGKRAFPFHCHRINEEMFFILEGNGEVRIGDERHPIRAGDIIACPPGSSESAHQISNTGTVELRYLAVSTKQSPEVCEYPDSGKYAVMADPLASVDGKSPGFRVVGRAGESVDYWEGE
ncbi:cupin domain-containing protein [Dyella tabacisoli]|uniref:Cupin domain-containing protein n=1 Tax=Dyella tabacisoli TaxID=2282381 RepID=A0A369UV54_9GAMM|nr:cupin domain-containing protein [Dyella tabacisoli]RDD83618.1 cupin domain-containing protein [Dyella tabacisoli]